MSFVREVWASTVQWTAPVRSRSGWPACSLGPTSACTPKLTAMPMHSAGCKRQRLHEELFHFCSSGLLIARKAGVYEKLAPARTRRRMARMRQICGDSIGVFFDCQGGAASTSGRANSLAAGPGAGQRVAGGATLVFRWRQRDVALLGVPDLPAGGERGLAVRTAGGGRKPGSQLELASTRRSRPALLARYSASSTRLKKASALPSHWAS